MLPDLNTFNTVPRLFWYQVKARSDAVSIWRKRRGVWESVTWGEYGRWSKDIANGLLALGILPGDKVSVLSQTRIEWVAVDMAIMGIGCITAPIYHSNTPEQVAYIVRHSDSRLVFVEDQEQLDKILETWKDLPPVETVVVFDKVSPQNLSSVMSLRELRELGRQYGGKHPNAFEERMKAVKPRDVISFIYTSGTTGPPKAAMITSENVLAIIKHLPELIHIREDDMTIAYLPLAHIAERAVGHFLKLMYGNQTVFAESIDDLAHDLRQTGPTVMFGTPRIFEKFNARITTAIHDASPFQRTLFRWALNVGQTVRGDHDHGSKKRFWPTLKLALAHFLIFRKIHEMFGGRMRFMLSGGAPISPEIIRYFHRVGLTIYEVYGMTETTGLISMNKPGDNKIGSAGKIFPGTEVKIEPDGEICARGPQMCVGYYKDEEGTKELLRSDGNGRPWLHTGDVGYVDDDGYLFITGRKKDIIITAGGKNVAPQNIENLIKTSPYVSQVMVCGDRRAYLTALITLDEDEIAKFARDRKILYQDLAALSRKEEVVNLIGRVIRDMNRELASYESIKKFRILEKDFDQDKEEITPTLKVKRKVIFERYSHLIEGMYN
ncbi:MAG: AMP-dependent synthetase/ligase [Fidelibacterota bacterium]